MLVDFRGFEKTRNEVDKMFALKAHKILLLTFVVGLCSSAIFAQGGWRQWEIHLVDGTTVEASPLQLRADGKFTRSMDPKEVGFDRAKIDYFAAIARNHDAVAAFPPAPTRKYEQDLIIFLDGKLSLGKVTFKSLKFSEGTIVQNGKEMSLENVAYIKFARAAVSSK